MKRKHCQHEKEAMVDSNACVLKNCPKTEWRNHPGLPSALFPLETLVQTDKHLQCPQLEANVLLIEMNQKSLADYSIIASSSTQKEFPGILGVSVMGVVVTMPPVSFKTSLETSPEPKVIWERTLIINV